MSPHFVGVCLFLVLISTAYRYSPALVTPQSASAPVLLLSCFKPLCSPCASPQTAMSSLAFMGFFCLAEGRRVMTTRANNTRIWHAHYTTTIQCADGSTLPANVRIYSPMNDVLHADNTIAFVYALAHIPTNSIVVMDASHVLPFPGDPLTDSYEDSVPNLPNPFVIALGHVSGNASHLPEGSRTFPILVSEYVRDNTQLCTLTYVRDLNILRPFSPDHYPSATFNSSRPRWKNTNVPFPGR